MLEEKLENKFCNGSQEDVSRGMVKKLLTE